MSETYGVVPREDNSSTAWDLVNIVGYAMGMPRSFIEYEVRRKSEFSYDYCQSIKALKDLREACTLRWNLMQLCAATRAKSLVEDYDEVLASVKNGVNVVLSYKWNDMFDFEKVLLQCQKKIDKLAPAIVQCIPEWFTPTHYIVRQFLLEPLSPGTTVTDLCYEVCSRQGKYPYYRDWRTLTYRIFMDDRDLVEELYQLHGADMSELQFPYSASKSTRTQHLESLREFCGTDKPTIIEIDTENADFTSTVSFLRLLEKEVDTSKVRINIYHSGFENSLWASLPQYVSFPVNAKTVVRVREEKSVVDMAIMASVLEAKYSCDNPNFMLMSSDCDYMVLPQQFPDLNICFCCNKKHTASSTEVFLRKNNLRYIYVDYIVDNLTLDKVTSDCLSEKVLAAVQQSAKELGTIALDVISQHNKDADAATNIAALNEVFGRLRIKADNNGEISISI